VIGRHDEVNVLRYVALPPHLLVVSFHCVLRAATSIKDAHAFTERIEQYLRSQNPNLGRVTVHTEPPVED
jgi:divalent metal cation (Fe/Co/Zn/Cd) transporter